MISGAVSASPETKTKTKRRKISAYLVRETIDGVEFYYPGFRQVLNKQKKLAEIMGDSRLQFFLSWSLAIGLLMLGLQSCRTGCGCPMAQTERGFQVAPESSLSLEHPHLSASSLASHD